MKQLDTMLNNAGIAARKDASPEIDVRSRVLCTIAARPETVKLDLVPIVFSGAAIAVATLLCVACLSSWQTMFNPWASFFAQ